MPLQALVRIEFRTHLCTTKLNNQCKSVKVRKKTFKGRCQFSWGIVVLQSDPEPRFEPKPFWTWPKFSPKFGNYEKLNPISGSKNDMIPTTSSTSLMSPVLIAVTMGCCPQLAYFFLAPPFPIRLSSLRSTRTWHIQCEHSTHSCNKPLVITLP